MLPSIFSIQSTLPLTPNGKIDRKALPAPHVVAVTAVAGVSDAMMTPAERRVAAVWRDILRVDRVGLHDNFFDIGGHSLLLVRLHANLKREFETPIELVELFQWTTVAAQAKRLSASGVLNPTHNSALQRAQARAARQLR
jgi:acyl carrier protein